MFISTVILMTLSLCYLHSAECFASQLTDKCDRKMEGGVKMMGILAEYDESFSIQLFRNDLTLVKSGETYEASEEMTAKLHPKVFQAAFEVRGALILNGKCNRTRTTGQLAVITFPSSSMGAVSVHAAWAKSYSSGVKLALPFIITPSVGLSPGLPEDLQKVKSDNELAVELDSRGVCMRQSHYYPSFDRQCSVYGPRANEDLRVT